MDSLVQQWTSSPTWAKALTFAALPTAGYALARFLDEYQQWRNMGPGGLSYNMGGFMMNLLMTATLARKDTKSLGMYKHPEKYSPGWKQASDEEKAKAKQSYLKGELKKREGKESNALYFVAPQRETNADNIKYFDPELQKAYLDAYNSLADRHSDAIEWKTSVLEKIGPAMCLKETYSLPTLIKKLEREVLHIHESDMSAHVVLSIADAKEVVAKGWGERHRVTGTVVCPLGYTLLYLPRNTGEVEVLVGILEAGVRYARSNGKGK